MDETGIALKDLLSKLTDKSLTLVSLPNCAEQKLQIHLKQRPLRSFMASIATLLSGNWTPSADKTGYRFSLTDGAILRRRRWWELYLGEQERALTAQRAAALATMRAPQSQWNTGEVNAPDEAGKTRLREAGIMSHLLFSQLPTDMQEQLAQQADEGMFTKSFRSDDGMTQGGALGIPMQDLSDSVQQAISHFLATNFKQDAPTVYIRLRNSGLQVSATFVDGTGHPTGGVALNINHVVSRDALLLDQRRLAARVKALGRNAPPEWKVLAEYQNSTVWKNSPPDAMPPGGWAPYRPQLLSRLAHKAGLEFVADYYSRPCTFETENDEQQPLRQPLKAELDYRAAELDMSWKRQADDIYLFRDNRWYRNDELEVPNARLKHWIRAWADVNSVYKQPLDRTAQIPADYAGRVLDLWSEMVGNLSLWQLNNGFKYAVIGDEAQEAISSKSEIRTIKGDAMPILQLPFGNLADLLMDDRHVLRFYAGLSRQDRMLLLSGTLAYDALSSEDQKSAAYLQPLLPFGLRMSQPISLGLVSPIAEGHAYIDGGQAASSWPNRTNISYVMLDITSPKRFPQSQTRSIR